MNNEISLRQALIQFYNEKGIEIKFSYNCNIKAAGVFYKQYPEHYIMYSFVVSDGISDNISFDEISYPNKISLVKALSLSMIGRVDTEIQVAQEFYWEDRNRDYLKFNNPLSKKNRKMDRVMLNKYKNK